MSLNYSCEIYYFTIQFLSVFVFVNCNYVFLRYETKLAINSNYLQVPILKFIFYWKPTNLNDSYSAGLVPYKRPLLATVHILSLVSMQFYIDFSSISVGNICIPTDVWLYSRPMLHLKFYWIYLTMTITITKMNKYKINQRK